MATTLSPNAATFDGIYAGPAPVEAKVGVLQSFLARLALARQRRQDAAIGTFISEHGGQLTDEVERQISRRFGTHAGQW